MSEEEDRLAMEARVRHALNHDAITDAVMEMAHDRSGTIEAIVQLEADLDEVLSCVSPQAAVEGIFRAVRDIQAGE